MPRGGKREGTPGKGYSNRTDMTSNYNMQSSAIPAAGGMEAPKKQNAPLSVYPEDTPMLLDPTQRPSEPLTAGLSTGAGPGPEVLDPRVDETRSLKKYLPLIEPLLNLPTTPDSVVSLVKYIKGA